MTRRRTIRSRAEALLLVVALGLVACQSPASPSPPPASEATAPVGSQGSTPARPIGPPDSAPPTVAAADPLTTEYAPTKGRDGGTITIGDWQEANQFNPYFLGQATDANVASAAWATLVVATHDGRWAPDLAVRIPTTADGGVRVPGDDGDAMTVTWTLRDGLAWSDGEALTCADFRYAWEWVLDPDNLGVLTDGFENITAVDCPSPTEMVWHFDRVYEGYIGLMTAPLPRHYLATIPMNDQTAGAGFRPTEVAKLPVSGAFRFESVAPGGTLRLVRNPRYRSFATGLPAHLERIEFRWFSDQDALIAAYRAGKIQVATGLDDAAMGKVRPFGRQVTAIPSRTYEVLRPNWSAEHCSRGQQVAGRGVGCPLGDPALRAAIAAAIDRPEIARLRGGAALEAGTSVQPSDWFFADQPAPAFDPPRARRLLDEAGWTVGADGIRHRDGLRARIELCTTIDPPREETAALIAAWLEDVGIEAIPNAVSPDDLFADHATATTYTPCALSRGNFDLALVALERPLDPLDVFFRYHSSQLTPNGANETSVADPAIDAALRRVQQSADFAEVRAAMAEFQRAYVEQTIEIPLYVRRDVSLVSPKLGNFMASASRSGPTWNAVDWYLK